MRRTLRTIPLAVLGTLIGVTTFADEQAQIDFANGLFSRSFYEDAAEEYRTYIRAHSSGTFIADAWYRLAESELALQHYEEALFAFDSLLALTEENPHRPRSVLRRGVALVGLRRVADAEAALKDAAKTPDTRAEANYYLGKLYFDTRKFEAASNTFRQLTNDNPESPLAPFARFQLAFTFLELGQEDKAAVQFSEVASSPNAPEALRVECRFRAAETYDRLGWFDAAVGAYQALQRNHPGSDYARRAEYGYAWSLYHAGHYAEATVAIDRVLRAAPDSERAAGLAYLKGNCFVQEERHAEAIGAFDALRTRYPDSEFADKAHYKIAWAMHLTGDEDGALRELDALLQQGNPGAMHGDAAFLRGEILAARGNYADAYEEFRLVAAQYGDSKFGPDARYKSGECLSLLGRHHEAMTAFDSYLQHHPQGSLATSAMLRAGDAAFLMGDMGAAVDRYSRLTARRPGGKIEELALYRLGTALHNIGNFKVCAETLLDLLARFPESKYAAESHLLVGDVYLRDASDTVRAITHYQAALDASPDGKHRGDALKGLALARYEARDFDGAAESFYALIVDHGSVELNAQTYTWLGDFYYRAENWPRCELAYLAFLNRNAAQQDGALAWYRVGEARAAQGMTLEAREAFQSAAAAAPKSAIAADAQLRIARLLEDLGQLEQAIALYEEAAGANGGDSAAQAGFRLGEVYETQGELGLAARQYMRVAILFLHEELSPESLLRAGACYAKLGERDRAKQTYTELITDFPNSAQADEARKRMGQTDGAP